MKKITITIISLLVITTLTACKSNSVKDTVNTAVNKTEGNQGGRTKAEFAEYIKGKIPQFNKIDELFKILDVDSNNLIDDSEFSKRQEVIQSLIGNNSVV